MAALCRKGVVSCCLKPAGMAMLGAAIPVGDAREEGQAGASPPSLPGTGVVVRLVRLAVALVAPRIKQLRGVFARGF